MNFNFKTILSLDLGTNSIGSSLIRYNEYEQDGEILFSGSRIMSFEDLAKYESGQSAYTTPASLRTDLRSQRKRKWRYKLRRTRLIRVFKLLKWIPEDFPENFKKYNDFEAVSQFNINNFMPFSSSRLDEMRKDLGFSQNDTICDDWMIYYLRSIGLNEKLTLSELARIIYYFNQKRGFKSTRKDLIEEDVQESKYVDKLEIISVEDVSEEGKKKKEFKITAASIESGKPYEWKTSKTQKPNIEKQVLRYLITIRNDKLLTPRLLTSDDWEAMLVSLDNELAEKKLTPGQYFWSMLKADISFRIKDNVVYRSRYEDEFQRIWKKQVELNPKLQELNNNKSLIKALSQILYSKNQAKQVELINHDLFYLFSRDIIYYQRDLKSQKHLIDECRFEKKKFTLPDGKLITKGYKCCPISKPEFQEFRILQDISNLRIIEKEKYVDGRFKLNYDVTNNYISKSKEELYELFDSRREVKEKDIFNLLGISDTSNFSINLLKSRGSLKGNETKTIFRNLLKKHNFNPSKYVDNPEKLQLLWHIHYSIIDIKGVESALIHNFPEFQGSSLIEDFIKLEEFPKKYAEYSSKAINKLLPLMRSGKYWSADTIHQEMREKIESFITGVVHDSISDRTWKIIRKYFKSNFAELQLDNFQDLPLYLCSYIVYDRFNEPEEIPSYMLPSHINPIEIIPNNSLRNPIVEQVLRETLHVVKDIWEQYEQPDEIHIEMARELQNTREQREKITKQNKDNSQYNEHIKKFLQEVKSKNYSDAESIYKSKLNIEQPVSFQSVFPYTNTFVQANEVKKFKLWVEQKFVSPYTLKPIPLNELFTDKYELEHILPQSKIKNDSLNNLIICERDANKLKGNRLARKFIEEFGGHPLTNTDAKILTIDSYIGHCKSTFNGGKLKNLVAEKLPESFISRQLNDTRYITRKIHELLKPVCRQNEGIKNPIIVMPGSVTNEMKENWGLKQLWKDLVKPRFERLEEITKEQQITYSDRYPNQYSFKYPESDFDIKRIDHRHHALDALVIAAITRSHVQYLSSLHAVHDDPKLKSIRQRIAKEHIRDFVLPWPSFVKDVRVSLDNLIVSHKARKNFITKPKNIYKKYVFVDGKWKLKKVKQEDNPKWHAVRKSMFKQPMGKIWIKEIKELDPIKAAAIHIERQLGRKDENGKPRDYIYDKQQRKLIDDIVKNIGNDQKVLKKHFKQNNIVKITVAVYNQYASKRTTINKNTNLDKIPYHEKSPLVDELKKHLEGKGNKPEEAFEGTGLIELQQKLGQNIKKVTFYEKSDSAIEFNGGLYETDKGGNIMYCIYEKTDTKERNSSIHPNETLSILTAVQRVNQGKNIYEEFDGYKTITISPDELVYVPTEEEYHNRELIDLTNKKKIFNRIYKMGKSTKKQCFFIHHNISKPIIFKVEFGSQNYTEFTIVTEPRQKIVDYCLKLKVDRLGNLELDND